MISIVLKEIEYKKLFFRDLMRKNIVFLIILILNISNCLPLSKEARSKNFVYLSEIDSTILISPRYCSKDNFVGQIIDGYKKPIIVLTKQAAQALKKVQEQAIKDGYCLVVYDAYRPKRAVKNFMRWSENLKDQSKKSQYFPRIDKKRVFELGYVMEKSSHSRGSCVDLTIIKAGKKLHKIKEKKRKLLDGFTITILDDGTVDMGSSFDLFDIASHYKNNIIDKKFQDSRIYLKNLMENNGFKNYEEEWWHFTLKNEPYPANLDSSYFDFPVE